MRTLAVFGWLLSLGLLMGIAGPLFGTCTQGSDDPWTASLIFYAPIGLFGLLLAWRGSPTGHHFCWLAAPHILTLALGSYFVPVYLQTTFGDQDVCSVREGASYGITVTALQRAWAPSWFCFLVALVWVFSRYWLANSGKNPADGIK